MTRRKTIGVAAAVVVAALLGWAWTQRTALAVWHYARQIAVASPDKREAFVTKLLPYGEAGQHALVRQLSGGGERTCTGCGWALARLLAIQGARDARTAEVAAALAARYPDMPPAGQTQVLLILQELLSALDDPPTEGLLRATASVLRAGSRHGECRPALLGLAAAYAQFPGTEEGWPACRALVAAGLSDARPACRAQAVRLAAVPALGMADQLVPLLSAIRPDPAPEVRTLVLLALGSREDVLATDDLLPFLHDADKEVRAVCEQALRTRGLSNAYLQLACMVTDPEPVVRAGVPGRVVEMPDLDTALWLARLSRDPSPAVRAAAVRAAGECQEPVGQAWVKALAENDPSPTVKQLAQFYLRMNDHR
jgi:hypothetical protein